MFPPKKKAPRDGATPISRGTLLRNYFLYKLLGVIVPKGAEDTVALANPMAMITAIFITGPNCHTAPAFRHIRPHHFSIRRTYRTIFFC